MMNHTGEIPYQHKYCNKVLTAFRGPHGIHNNPASYGLTSSPGVLDIDGLREGGLKPLNHLYGVRLYRGHRETS